MNETTAKDSAVIQPWDLIAPEGYQAQWREDLSDEAYHADATATGSSNLRLMLNSPKAFHERVFKRAPQEETDALRLGKMIHLAVLEGSKFRERYQVMPEFTGITLKGEVTTSSNCKEVKEKKAAWLAALKPDAVILKTPQELDMILGIIDSIMNHKRGPEFMRNGKAELPGYYRDEETGIRLKIKPDFISFDGVRLNDLKSCASAEWKKFGSHAFERRYDIQMFMQGEGIRHITGKFPEVISLIAVEKKPPYESAIYYFMKEDLVQAETDYRTALRLLRQHISENRWPQRQQEIERIYTPQWFINKSVEGM